MKVVVVGGGGLIGSRLVRRLDAQGHQALPASRTTGVDAVTGAGLAAAMKDAQVVIDVTNPPSFEIAAATKFFETSTRNLLAAEEVANARHHIVLSVVGADRMRDVPYMRAKVAQEVRVRAGRIPYTILRATQFFEFIGAIADGGTEGAAARLPPVLMQPIAADDVVAVLADLAEGEPRNGVVDLAGPDRIRMDEVARRLLKARNDPRQVIGDASALYFGGKVDDRSLIPADDHRVGSTRFEDWLEAGD
ncbi:MAG TPA: SDR family oxidoreductase [Vicinamibacteria bacterium]|nr:SDR family oxidoreductase [Vicinamibacteria bacterium]